MRLKYPLLLFAKIGNYSDTSKQKTRKVRIFVRYNECRTTIDIQTGEVRLVDFTPLMQKGICSKLQDLDYFKSFRLDPFRLGRLRSP